MTCRLWTMRLFLFASLILLLCPPVLAEDASKVVTFGVANGYPPYQFQTEDGHPTGLDVDVIRLIGERLDIDVRIVQGPWDDMVTALRVGHLDCVGGMEINAKRQTIFDFTGDYYTRKGAVFILADNQEIKTLGDLVGKFITGDRLSYVEERFIQLGIKSRIRIRQTESKDMSLRLLKQREVVAMVAPKAVGYYLAARHGVAVKVLDDTDPGSPVGLAVIKGNARLRDRLDRALEELRTNGELDGVLRKWQIK